VRAIVGLLGIAKCLNDAISKLERACAKGKLKAENAVKEMISMKGAAGTQAAALKMSLSPLLLQAFGGDSSLQHCKACLQESLGLLCPPAPCL